MDTEPSEPIVFFDGYCGLCNLFVNFLLRMDSQDLWLFSPLQGKSAERLLTAEERLTLQTGVIRFPDGSKLIKSQGIIALLKMKGSWTLFIAQVLGLVPTFLADLVYDFIAANRYSLFGKKDVCRLPTPEERQKFLD